MRWWGLHWRYQVSFLHFLQNLSMAMLSKLRYSGSCLWLTFSRFFPTEVKHLCTSTKSIMFSYAMVSREMVCAMPLKQTLYRNDKFSEKMVLSITLKHTSICLKTWRRVNIHWFTRPYDLLFISLVLNISNIDDENKTVASLWLCKH